MVVEDTFWLIDCRVVCEIYFLSSYNYSVNGVAVGRHVDGVFFPLYLSYGLYVYVYIWIFKILEVRSKLGPYLIVILPRSFCNVDFDWTSRQDVQLLYIPLQISELQDSEP